MKLKEHQRVVSNGSGDVNNSRPLLSMSGRSTPDGLVSSGGGGIRTVPVPQIAAGGTFRTPWTENVDRYWGSIAHSCMNKPYDFCTINHTHFIRMCPHIHFIFILCMHMHVWLYHFITLCACVIVSFITPLLLSPTFPDDDACIDVEMSE